MPKKTFDTMFATIIGKNSVGAVTKEDINEFWTVLDKIVLALDESDCEDAWGTKGWRHFILGED